MQSQPQEPAIASPISSAYLHIPFCRRRCFYCDFPIAVVGERRDRTPSQSIPPYLAALTQEIEITAARSTPQPLATVFFGGGTPSLLTPEQLDQLLTALDHAFGLAVGVEIAMEIDPGTFTFGQLHGYRSAGVNRFSLGVQAFQDELLQTCGRSHSVAEIYDAVAMIRRAQIDNFSLDLISGLPHQTREQWQDSLEAAIAIAPAHLSCYDLVLEPVTPFGKRYSPGETPLPDDDLTADLYRIAQAHLTAAGYDHYEISNYARPGFACRHNRTYWENRPYYALGMGAASYTDGIRFSRPRTRQAYYDWLAAGATIPDEPETDCDRLLETLMLGLRLREGVRCDRFTPSEQAQIRTTLAPYAAQGWVTLGDDAIALTDPDGFLFSNTILASLFAQFDPDSAHR
ncbi:radical SAM family heme chaperone HemW [Spirulina major CS-329]|uniref:radical SAM family heme chaperone HemW n=1 Tax=Spirulina TaxID=1154 RepID=UPI00232D25CA|nr:radical SAM family heme chaperone HemW [Spirulina major]MDB9493622.1 radical SAM family heme chaperone HemW [Spirulina subsalsa CS-330]MDB9502378.1 radical SAM family heme chaperone HemW [Spirulina major CS-329]